MPGIQQNIIYREHLWKEQKIPCVCQKTSQYTFKTATVYVSGDLSSRFKGHCNDFGWPVSKTSLWHSPK